MKDLVDTAQTICENKTQQVNVHNKEEFFSGLPSKFVFTHTMYAPPSSLHTQPCLRFPPALVQELIQSSVSTLEHTWAWVVSVLDVAEGQLQQGQMFNTQVSLDSLLMPNQNTFQSAMQFG